MDRNGNRTNSGVNDVNRRLFENAGTDWAVFDRRLFCHGHHHQTGKFLKFVRLKKFCLLSNYKFNFNFGNSVFYTIK